MEIDNIECVSSSDGIVDEDEIHHHNNNGGGGLPHHYNHNPPSHNPYHPLQFGTSTKTHNNNGGTNTVGPTEIAPATSVHELLECPVCTNSMYPPIHQPGNKEVDTQDRMQKLLFLLHKLLPLLRHIQQEQKSELDVELNTSGGQLTENNVIRLVLEDDGRVYCNNCNTSVANFNRSFPNCSYDLCITCCRQIRESFQSRNSDAEQHFVQSLDNNQGTDSCELNPNSNKIPECAMNFPDWKAEANARIPCTPEAQGGCGSGTLELRQIFEPNWVDQLIPSAEKLVINYQPISMDFSHGCSLCPIHSTPESKAKDLEVARQAAFRENSCDNFLYCPSAVELGDSEIEHFSNALDKRRTSYSWECT